VRGRGWTLDLVERSARQARPEQVDTPTDRPYEFEFYTATAPASARQRQLALAVVGAAIVGYVLVATHAAVQLPRVNSFIPTVYAIICITDVVTAILLFAQFWTTGSRPLLVLASGYLFSGLMVVVQALAFPGAFVATGLLGAGPQTVAWLNPFWRIGLGGAIAVYAVLRSRAQMEFVAAPLPRPALWQAVAIVVAAVCALTFLTIVGHDLLPPLFQEDRVLPLGHFVNGAIALMNLLALLLLVASTRGRSILDLWLIVAAFSLLAESTTVAFFISERYSLGFYALRAVTVPVSKVVLVVLLWETMRLYASLAVSNRELRRERVNRLTNAAMGLAAIAHEIRQPLTGIALTASAGQRVLKQTPPDIGKAREFFGEIQTGAAQAHDMFVGLLRLFKGQVERDLVDVNALTIEATRSLRQALEENDVVVQTKLTSSLPAVQGHAVQLREVILNLIQNSIDAMAPTTNTPRVINIETSWIEGGAISISLQDNGPGIEPQALGQIFDPFVTTKANGTGLGLGICKMIVEHHGGRISATSDENGGARFDIVLPAASV
jgi:signal transduction histidine kinase